MTLLFSMQECVSLVIYSAVGTAWLHVKGHISGTRMKSEVGLRENLQICKNFHLILFIVLRQSFLGNLLCGFSCTLATSGKIWNISPVWCELPYSLNVKMSEEPTQALKIRIHFDVKVLHFRNTTLKVHVE